MPSLIASAYEDLQRKPLPQSCAEPKSIFYIRLHNQSFQWYLYYGHKRMRKTILACGESWSQTPALAGLPMCVCMLSH